MCKTESFANVNGDNVLVCFGSVEQVWIISAGPGPLEFDPGISTGRVFHRQISATGVVVYLQIHHVGGGVSLAVLVAAVWIVSRPAGSTAEVAAAENSVRNISFALYELTNENVIWSIIFPSSVM